MSIISEISRIEGASGIIKAKTVELGLNKTANTKVSLEDKIEDHAAAINTISARTVSTSKLTANTTAVTIETGYYGTTSTISVDTMSAPTVSLSGSSQTISCKDKLMTDNITVPAANVFRTGSDAPTSSTPGNDGDLYLVI